MTIAVYCSAKDNIPEDYLQLGRDLGDWIAQNGHTLVYGGATGGLMSRVSNHVHQNGGRIIGVIPPCIVQAGRQADNCDKLFNVSDMAERKRVMRQLADCFIVLPGSNGTLDEMLDVVASGTVGEHHKPLFVLNYRNFYEHLKLQYEHMTELKFLPRELSYQPYFVDTLAQLTQVIEQIKVN